MKRAIVCLVVLLVFPCLIFAQAQKQQPPPPPAAKGAAAEQELIKLEKEWADAVVKVNLTALGRILADDFAGTDPDGMLWTKTKSLDVLKSGEDKVSAASLDDLKVRVYGDAAVVTGRSTVKEVYQGRDVSGQYRFTDTFVKRDGRWQCVATQSTKIVKK